MPEGCERREHRRSIKPRWRCRECGRPFYSDRAASKAQHEGCPLCGGVHIGPEELAIPPSPGKEVHDEG